jgi:hypothetical protein
MYCSTCGAYMTEERTHCTECGSAVGLRARPEQRPTPRFGSEDRRWMVQRNMGVCPRCSYRGEGLSYFSRGSHAAALVGATVLTMGAMGAGGVLYYLIRRDHRVCPRCGKGWGRFGETSLPPTTPPLAERPRPRVPATRTEGVRRTWSVLLWVFAVIMIVGAVASVELAPALFGAAAGAGGWLLHRSANQAREERRAALLADMQLPVLQLAGERGGKLTVTEVAATLGWPMRRAEKVLQSLDDGLRVNSEVSDEGVIVYEFLEVMHSPRRLAGGDDAEAGDQT